MSTTYKGVAGNVTAGASVSILNSAHSTPIGVTTSAPHGLTTGDVVDIHGHQVNTAANGNWAVVVANSTQFSLVGSAGNGVGAATGTVDSLAFNQTVQEPSDGDAATASSVNNAPMYNADQSAALLGSVGKWKLVDMVAVQRDFSGLVTSWTTINTTAANTWVQSSPAFETICSNVQIGDIVELEYHVNVSGGTSGQFYALSLWSTNQAPGASLSPVRVPAAGHEWYQTTGSGEPIPVAMKAFITATATGLMQFALYGMTNNSSADTIIAYDDMQAIAKVWRPTLLATQ